MTSCIKITLKIKPKPTNLINSESVSAYLLKCGPNGVSLIKLVKHFNTTARIIRMYYTHMSETERANYDPKWCGLFRNGAMSESCWRRSRIINGRAVRTEKREVPMELIEKINVPNPWTWIDKCSVTEHMFSPGDGSTMIIHNDYLVGKPVGWCIRK